MLYHSTTDDAMVIEPNHINYNFDIYCYYIFLPLFSYLWYNINNIISFLLAVYNCIRIKFRSVLTIINSYFRNFFSLNYIYLLKKDKIVYIVYWKVAPDSISHTNYIIQKKYILLLFIIRLLYAGGRTVFFCSMFL